MLGLRKGNAGALSNHAALLLGHGGIDVQHEGVDVPAQLSDNKRHPFGHQACDERHIAREPVQLGHDNRALQLLGFPQCCGELWASPQRICSLAGFDVGKFLTDLHSLVGAECSDNPALAVETEAGTALLFSGNTIIGNDRF